MAVPFRVILTMSLLLGAGEAASDVVKCQSQELGKDASPLLASLALPSRRLLFLTCEDLKLQRIVQDDELAPKTVGECVVNRKEPFGLPATRLPGLGLNDAMCDDDKGYSLVVSPPTYRQIKEAEELRRNSEAMSRSQLQRNIEACIGRLKPQGWLETTKEFEQRQSAEVIECSGNPSSH